MNLDAIKKDLDNFMRDLFYGFSTFVFAKIDQGTMNYGKAMLQPRAGLVKDKPNTSILDIFLGVLDEYNDNKLDEESTRQLHKTIIRFRALGLIIHNNDAISSLRMEKMTVENEIRKLLSENEILSAELKRYKEFVALQGKTVKSGIE
jgi:hypothetical protein